MRRTVVEILPEGRANVYFETRLWKREEYPVVEWKKVAWRDTGYELLPTSRTGAKVLEAVYQQDLNEPSELERFPRLGIPGKIDGFRQVPLLSQLRDESLSWLVDGMIPRGSITLLTGPPSGYKTWLALVLAKSVSEGTQFLGRRTLKTPVLYLDQENPSTVIRDGKRILNLSDGYFLKLWGIWWDDPPPQIGDERLLEIARELQPVIVFDPLRRSHDRDENNATQMSELMRWLRQLTRHGATVVVIHHQDKSKTFKFRGSSDILAGVDVALALSTDKRMNLTLECFKHRYVLEFQHTIRPDFERGRFDVVDDSAKQAVAGDIAKIKAVIKRRPGISQQKLLAACALPETKGAKLLQEEADKSWFRKHGEKKAWRYYLTAEEAR